jgi:hypothetical protein
VDLTGAKLFFQDPDQHKIFNDIVCKHGADKTVLWEEGRVLKYHAVTRMLLRAIHTLHFYWNRSALLTTPEVSHYIESIGLFRKTWTALGWKPTVWVHWVCAHSGFYMASYRSIYTFCSIPTEYRHQKYKLDLRHAFEGWKFKNPSLTHRWLKRVVDLDALDQGLRVFSLTNHHSIFKKNKKAKLF